MSRRTGPPLTVDPVCETIGSCAECGGPIEVSGDTEEARWNIVLSCDCGSRTYTETHFIPSSPEAGGKA